MNEAIILEIGGIKCDTQGCDYRDDSVKVEDYSDWLNKPCTKCGGNLLTQADYDNVQTMLAVAKMMNSIFPAPTEHEELAALKIEMDGTGKVDMTISEYEKN